MQQADYDYSDFDKAKQAQLDEKLFVKFFYKTRPDKGATEENGRPVFKEVVYIDIMVPGSKSGVCRPARQSDIDRFPRHYAAFQNRVEAPIEGTPLSEWPAISRSMVEQLAFMNVKTVEQLADLNDNYASQIMGGQMFKKKAKDFLEFSKEAKEHEDAEELKRENQELRNQVNALLGRVEALEGATVEPEPATEVQTVPEVGDIEATEENVAQEAKQETPEEAKKRKQRDYQRQRRKKAKEAKQAAEG